jgi:hypothetical protein
MARTDATIRCQPWMRMVVLLVTVVALLCLWAPYPAVAATASSITQLRGSSRNRHLNTAVEDFPCPESNNCMLGDIQGQRIHRAYFFGLFCQAKCELTTFPLLVPKIESGLYQCGECPSSDSAVVPNQTSPSLSTTSVTVERYYYFEEP